MAEKDVQGGVSFMRNDIWCVLWQGRHIFLKVLVLEWKCVAMIYGLFRILKVLGFVMERKVLNINLLTKCSYPKCSFTPNGCVNSRSGLFF